MLKRTYPGQHSDVSDLPAESLPSAAMNVIHNDTTLRLTKEKAAKSKHANPNSNMLTFKMVAVSDELSTAALKSEPTIAVADMAPTAAHERPSAVGRSDGSPSHPTERASAPVNKTFLSSKAAREVSGERCLVCRAKVAWCTCNRRRTQWFDAGHDEATSAATTNATTPITFLQRPDLSDTETRL